MIKNKAGQYITGILKSGTDGSPITTGTTTVVVLVDELTIAGTGTISHASGGVWRYMPTIEETNGNDLTFIFSNSLALTYSSQVFTKTEKECNPIIIGDCTVTVEEVKEYCNPGLSDAFIEKYIYMVEQKIGPCLEANYDEVTASFIVLNLVAHLTCGKKGQKSSTRAPNGASISFNLSAAKDGLRSSEYGEQAFMLDTAKCYTGLLADTFMFEVVGC